MNQCVATADLNRYLDQMDADERYREAVDQRVEELLADDYAPFDVGNLGEALGEIDIDGIAKQLADGKTAEAGASLATLVRDYWERIARAKAEKDINNERANACPRCKGRGFRSCDEDYERDN